MVISSADLSAIFFYFAKVSLMKLVSIFVTFTISLMSYLAFDFKYFHQFLPVFLTMGFEYGVL